MHLPFLRRQKLLGARTVRAVRAGRKFRYLFGGSTLHGLAALAVKAVVAERLLLCYRYRIVARAVAQTSALRSLSLLAQNALEYRGVD